MRNTFDTTAMLLCVLIGADIAEIFNSYNTNSTSFMTFCIIILVVLILSLSFHLTKNKEKA